MKYCAKCGKSMTGKGLYCPDCMRVIEETEIQTPCACDLATSVEKYLIEPSFGIMKLREALSAHTCQPRDATALAEAVEKVITRAYIFDPKMEFGEYNAIYAILEPALAKYREDA